MEFLIVLIVIFGVIVYNSLSWGFVFFKFYAWFVLPVFATLPELGFWPAVGLMLFVGLFHGKHLTPEKTNNSATAATLLLGPWITLAIGWLIGSIWIF